LPREEQELWTEPSLIGSLISHLSIDSSCFNADAKTFLLRPTLRSRHPYRLRADAHEQSVSDAAASVARRRQLVAPPRRLQECEQRAGEKKFRGRLRTR